MTDEKNTVECTTEAIEAPTFPDGGRKAYLVVLGCFLAMGATLGIANANGTIENHIASEILPHELSSTLSWIFAGFNFFAFASVLVLGPLYNQLGAKLMLVCSFFLVGIGLMCFSVSNAIYQFILSYIVTGVGVSFGYTTAITSVTQWFSKNRSFATGIALVGASVGGIVVPPILRALFKLVGFGWAIRILGFISMGLLAISFFLVADRRAHLGLGPSGGKRTSILSTLKQIDFKHFKELRYTTLVLGMVGNSGPYFLTLNYIVSYATANGWSASSAFNIPVVMNASSILGRVGGGWIADRYGRFNFFILLNLISGVAIFVCWLPPPIGHTTAGLYVYAVIFGFTSGSYFQSSPTCTAQISTIESFASRYGTVCFVVSLVNFALLPIGGAIVGHASLKGFDHLVIFVGALQAVGIVFSLVVRHILAGARRVVV